jgi:UDP-N-acetylglucosamine--N-acetylmuramyl-(pentapeptide) pyrophosphoryl-undecaprenol N-acetylglucosamine transferase
MVARVCLVSGGTGGHLVPALVLARALRKDGHEPLLVTEGRRVEREFLERESVQFEIPAADAKADGAIRSLSPAPLRAVGIAAGGNSKLRLPMWLVRSTLSARRMLRERGVDAVVSTGGRASVPVGLAARSLGLPLFLLEQNAVLGRANRLLQPLAKRTYLGLPADTVSGRGGGHARTATTGTPLRPQLYDVDRRRARAELGLMQDRPVVLVTGGSQGAQSLNRVVPQAILGVSPPPQVLHLAGAGHDIEVAARYGVDRGAATVVRTMTMDMATMLGAADLVVCRGGGSTVAELMAVGRAAVVVPYPHHKDQQQLRNARVLERAGAAHVLEESELDARALAALIERLLKDPARLRAMEEAARNICPADPVQTILADMRAHGGLAENA